MNIFVLDTDPQLCAAYHCDSHVRKMVLESAQILCTALLLNGAESAPYKPAQPGNRYVLWAAKSRANFDWLLQLGFWLAYEYKLRYGKEHASEKVIMYCSLQRSIIKEGELTPFATKFNENYAGLSVVEAYRKYYKEEKGYLLNYKTQAPHWLS